MTVALVAFGLAAIAVIVTIVALVVERARERAWRRIAEERRWNWEQRNHRRNGDYAARTNQ